ncbi:MAG: hypothetical protein AB1414_00595 [bacterium]
MTKYIFPSVYDYSDFMLSELEKDSSIKILEIKPMSIFMKFLWLIKTKSRLGKNKLFSHFFFNIFYSNVNFDNSICIVFDSFIFFNDPCFYTWITKKYRNVERVSIIYNVIGQNKDRITFVKKHFDQVYCFDPIDAEKYGFFHFWGIYSKQQYNKVFNLFDVSFVGLDKGRLDTIQEISAYLKNNDVVFKNIVISDRIDYTQDSGLVVSSYRVSYRESLEILLHSNSILEVVPDIQTGLSLRTIEAIIYGKKLVTNNKYLLQSPFFNKENMIIFDNINDIDIGFIKSHKQIDYAYKNDFSPTELIKRIESKARKNI